MSATTEPEYIQNLVQAARESKELEGTTAFVALNTEAAARTAQLLGEDSPTTYRRRRLAAQFGSILLTLPLAKGLNLTMLLS